MPDRPGRPRVSSRDTLADAACELFLERGYGATTVDDIARRAGVARSSFFSYFASKSDVVWAAFDDRLAAASTAIVGDADVGGSLIAIGTGFGPDALALALRQAEAMGLADELDRDRALRQHRLARAISARRRAGGASTLAAEIHAAGLAAAVFAALDGWAADPAAATLDTAIAAALQVAGEPRPPR